MSYVPVMALLILLRHAEAVTEDSAGDHARPLTQHGRASAIAIGHILRNFLPTPLLVVASDARRTRETATLAFSSLGEAGAITFEGRLYGASADALLSYVQQLEQAHEVVLLVGHNPGLSDIGRELAGTGSGTDLARLKAGFPPAAAAVFDVDGLWSKLQKKAGRVQATLVPGATDWPT